MTQLDTQLSTNKAHSCMHYKCKHCTDWSTYSFLPAQIFKCPSTVLFFLHDFDQQDVFQMVLFSSQWTTESSWASHLAWTCDSVPDYPPCGSISYHVCDFYSRYSYLWLLSITFLSHFHPVSETTFAASCSQTQVAKANHSSAVSDRQ